MKNYDESNRYKIIEEIFVILNNERNYKIKK